MNNSIPNENRHADTKSTPDNSKKLAEYFALDERVDAELEFLATSGNGANKAQ